MTGHAALLRKAVLRKAVLRKALRQAWLLAGLVAVITGLLGMHVLAAGHASHGSLPDGAMSHGAIPYGATPHSAMPHAAGASSTAAPGHALADCSVSCPGAQESGAPCIPSAPGGPVTVYPPQATLAAFPAPSRSGTPRAYSYLPPGPTPCGLSISRT